MTETMRLVFLMLSLLTALPTALAGPVEGDLFGYRLGAAYPVGADTKFMNFGVVLAERPEMPSDFERVELITTPKTFTIANIYGIAEFKDVQGAEAFAARYADLLNTLHGRRCSSMEAYLGEALKLLCAGKYELSVHHFKPDNPSEKHKVHVGLRFNLDSEAGKGIEALFMSEFRQLESEGKKQRLDEALKEQKLKGMQ